MGSGIVLGLFAALCWGVADFCARGATQAAGTLRTLWSVNAIATAALLLVGLPSGLLSLSGHPTSVVLVAASLNLVIMGGAALLYRAFAIGTLSLVSPIAASFAAITALLALASGEHPAPAQLAGIALTLGGVALASTAPGHPAMEPRQRVRLGRLHLAPGLIEALCAMLLFGVCYWALRYVVAALGGVTVVFIGKLSDLLVLSALVAAVALWPVRSAFAAKPEVSLWRRVTARGFLVWAVPVALLDTTANLAYNLGIATALTSVVSVLSSLFSAVTVLLAAIFLGERLARWQWAGVAAILLGIALVSR
jgi:drug/metabolite transporter (DMT)-like permease